MTTSKPVREFVPLPGQEFATPVPPYVKSTPDPYGLPKSNLTPEELEELNKPNVLISGGGIGGLTLALLLHKANIPFLVLEKAKEIKPLGSAIQMGPSVAALFKQLGIWDEFLERSKVWDAMAMYKEDLTPVHSMASPWLANAVGCYNSVISRPELYDLLFNSIPRERILLGKRVLSLTQNETSVMVACSDSSSYHGDILVGADGAYSAVRQNLYKELKVAHKLPSSDDVTLPFSCVCLVGQTVPLDPEEFPDMGEELTKGHTMLGISTMCTWLTVTTRQNTVCWGVVQFLDKESSKLNDSFRNSEWGPEAAEALAKEVRTFKVPGGKDGKVLTLGDYIDKTPAGMMSKVMLEEIVFHTWYGGRTVLLGDACHKMNPMGGVGGINAIHDAVTLANWLSTLRVADDEGIEAVFKEYRAERYPVAMEAFKSSQMFTHNLGKSWLSVLVRGIIKRLPTWLWKRIIYKMFASRPQCSFLPLIKDDAPVKPSYQPSLHKTLPILQQLSECPPVAASGSGPMTV
ncbi:hypothetical protein MVEG_03458 [Podila verticillata NRRL 6337]|nr:hypothetical protein MVEG_03458 [Podila verticillata NRRL 6337]